MMLRALQVSRTCILNLIQDLFAAEILTFVRMQTVINFHAYIAPRNDSAEVSHA